MCYIANNIIIIPITRECVRSKIQRLTNKSVNQNSLKRTITLIQMIKKQNKHLDQIFKCNIVQPNMKIYQNIIRSRWTTNVTYFFSYQNNVNGINNITHNSSSNFSYESYSLRDFITFSFNLNV